MIYVMGLLLNGVALWIRQVNELPCSPTDNVVGEIQIIQWLHKIKWLEMQPLDSKPDVIWMNINSKCIHRHQRYVKWNKVSLYLLGNDAKNVITNLVDAPWGDPIQEGKGKASKVMTYDIQDFWKNSNVTPVRDIGTSDLVKTHSPGGRPYDQETLKQGKRTDNWRKLGRIS